MPRSAPLTKAIEMLPNLNINTDMAGFASIAPFEKA